MKMKRIVTSAIAGILLAANVAGCSAYKNPTKYITLPSDVTISAAEVKEKLDERINDILEEGRDSHYTELEDEDATVQMGDSVAIYYTGTLVDESVELTESERNGMNNRPAEGEEGEPHDLVIGSDSFIGAYESEEHPENNNKGFEEQLIGAKKGDKLTITVTFPDSYETTAFRGKIANFDVEIVSISRNLIDDDSTVGIDFSFEKDDASTDDETEGGETEGGETEGGNTDAEGGDNTESKDNSEVTESADAPEDEEGEDADTDKSDDNTDGEEGKEGEEGEEAEDDGFDDLFKDGEFEIDYTADEIEGTFFNDLFNIADYAEIFKGQHVYFEHTFTYTVPEDVDEKFADFVGTRIIVTLKVCEVTSLPEWDDDYVAEYTSDEYKTVDSFTEYLDKSVKQEMAYDAILEATEVNEYPMSEVKKTYKTYVDSYVSEKLNGNSPSSYTNSELKEILTDEVYEDIYARAASSAYAAVKERLVVEALIEHFNIKLSNKEYKEKRSEYFTENQIYFVYYYGVNTEKAMEKYLGKDALKLQFLTEKLYDTIVDYVTIVD